ncbi:hypothetical protein IQ06DRAFT_65558 [Phaeosphaeriaceae sp. SRC1lsM3a]|nr:hypothetical protein IQ06DRAFT_65558 [Stagonospora sp. SRC1lsM3a]
MHYSNVPQELKHIPSASACMIRRPITITTSSSLCPTPKCCVRKSTTDMLRGTRVPVCYARFYHTSHKSKHGNEETRKRCVPYRSVCAGRLARVMAVIGG